MAKVHHINCVATGKEVVKQSLEQGYKVTVSVHNTSAVQLEHATVRIIQGDVLQPATFVKEISASMERANVRQNFKEHGLYMW